MEELGRSINDNVINILIPYTLAVCITRNILAVKDCDESRDCICVKSPKRKIDSCQIIELAFIGLLINTMTSFQIIDK